MSRNRSEPLFHRNHPRPTTRREFLAQGWIGFSGVVALPSLVGLFSRHLSASECGGTSALTGLPFMVFDMAGGAALPGNFLVGKKESGDLLSAYNRLGWDPRESGALNESFGLPMSAKASMLLAGILATSSNDARTRLRMGSICHFAQDDTSGNRMNIASMVLKSQGPGRFIGNGMGVINSLSGGNSSQALEEFSLKPTYIASLDDVFGASHVGGDAFKDIGVNSIGRMVEGSQSLSKIQAASLKELNGGDLLESLSECAYGKSVQIAAGVTGLDPRADANAAQSFNVNAQTPGSDRNVIAAAIAMNALSGFAGPGVWTLGGCDYHDGTQTTGDGKDLEMGQMIGRSVELAHRLQRPFFFQLITDGGVDANPGTRQWRGDSGDKCMTILGFYHPKGAPKLRRTQVGSYTDGQGADRSTLVGSNSQLAAYAAFANYLNCCGKLGAFGQLVPGVFAEAGQLDSVLIFEGAPA